MLNLFTIWYHKENTSHYFQKKKKDIDNYKRQKAKPCEWDILGKSLVKEPPPPQKKEQLLSKFNFQRLEIMVRVRKFDLLGAYLLGQWAAKEIIRPP